MTAVAVLGTGTIGEPIARNLARAGFDVTVWNRTREKAEPLAEDGATVCDAAAGAAQRAEIVLTVLADADATAETVEEIEFADGAVWAQVAALGLDPREFLATMEGSQIDTPYLHLKGEAMLERRLEPSFKLELAAKDASLVLEAADRAGVEARVARAVREAFERGIELGHGEEDMAAVYFAAKPD